MGEATKAMAIQYSSVNDYLASILTTEKLISVLMIVINIVIILILRKVVTKIILKLIDKFFNEKDSERFKLDFNRMKTLKSVINSIVIYGIYAIAYGMVLEQLNMPIKTLIATAGIGGLAIGFGAQNLVKDVITGFFILFEDQFTVGDYITIDGESGVVEEVALRITKIKDFNGDLHIIPNGTIARVTNKCRGSMRALVEMGIAYEENIDEAMAVLEKESKLIGDEYETIVDGPKILGVTNLGESDVVITVIARTRPMEQWNVERIMRKRFKEALDKGGIEIPYPKSVVYRGE